MTFNTNNSPNCLFLWGLIVSFFGIRRLTTFPATAKAKDTEPPALVHGKVQRREHQQEQTEQRRFSHVMPCKPSVLGGHRLTKVISLMGTEVKGVKFDVGTCNM